MTVWSAERGGGPEPEPQAAVDALRSWQIPHMIGHFARTLIEWLLAAGHL
jgi:hypothetical protein